MRVLISLLVLISCAGCYKADNSGMYNGVPQYNLSVHWKDTTSVLSSGSHVTIPVAADTTLYFRLEFKLVRGKAEKYRYRSVIYGHNAANKFSSGTVVFQLNHSYWNTIMTGNLRADDTVTLRVEEQSSGSTLEYPIVFRVR